MKIVKSWSAYAIRHSFGRYPAGLLAGPGKGAPSALLAMGFALLILTVTPTIAGFLHRLHRS